MRTDSAAGKFMRRATKHIQLLFLYIQDSVSTGVVRLRKAPTKDNLAGLHRKCDQPKDYDIVASFIICTRSQCTTTPILSGNTATMFNSRITIA